MTLSYVSATPEGIDPVLDDADVPGDENAALSGRQRFWAKFRRNRLAIAAGIVLLFIVLVAIFAPLVTTQDPNIAKNFADFLKGPNDGYWWGTDGVGRDIYTRVIFGARYALQAALIAVSIALLVGVPLGLTIGYFRGWADRIVMRIVEAVVAVPAVVFAIALIAVIED